MNIFFYNSAAGQLKNGVQYGPKCITDKLDPKCNIIKPIQEKGPRDSNKLNYDEMSDDCHLMYMAILENHVDKSLFLGGDHSIAIGTVPAMLEKYNDLFVIWIDAHADINTSETSQSQSIHGMPLTQITGLETKYRFDWIKKYLSFNNLIYIGIRDIDEGESEFIKKHNIKVITVDNIELCGIESITEMIRDIIGKRPLHISLDIDGIDPKYFPSTGTKVDNGLELADVCYLIKELNDNIKSMDIAELNPLLGSNDDIKKSVDNVIQLVESFCL